MKNFLLSIIAVMMTSSSSAQDFVLDSIKYITSETNYITNTTTIKTNRYRTFTYNSQGLCLSENDWFTGNSNPTVTYLYSYDLSGNLLRMSTNFYDDGSLKESGATEYTYYDNNLLRSMVKYTTGRYGKREVSDSAYYKYDDNQRLSSEYKMWPYNETYEYDYDDKGNIIKSTTYNQEKEICRIERSVYDDDGRIIYKQGTNQTSKDSIAYSYNDKGLLNQEVQYGWNNGEYIYSWRYNFYYNEHYLLTKEHVDQYYKSYGKFFGYYEQEFEYDDSGNVICHHVKRMKNGNLVDGSKIYFDYDEHGNTTKIYQKNYDGDKWIDIQVYANTEFSYNHGMSKFTCKLNTDLSLSDSIFISYRDKEDILTSIPSATTAPILYTLIGNNIRFNISAEDFRYMFISNPAGQTVHYVKPFAILSKGVNFVRIKTVKGTFTYKIMVH